MTIHVFHFFGGFIQDITQVNSFNSGSSYISVSENNKIERICCNFKFYPLCILSKMLTCIHILLDPSTGCMKVMAFLLSAASWAKTWVLYA